MFNETISGISGVAPGGKALIPVDTERRLGSITLRPSGTFVVAGDPTVVASPSVAQMASAIDLIEVVVNTTIIRAMTVQELIDENTANGLPFTNGELKLHFFDPKRATVSGEEATGWPLYQKPWGVNSMTVRVTYNAAAVAPALAASYAYDFELGLNTAGQSFANIVYWKRYTMQVAAAGDKDLNTLDVDGVIQRITLRSANVTKVIATVGARTVHDQDAIGNTGLLASYGVTPQANTYPLYFDYRQVLSDGLDTGGRALKLKITHSGAGDYTVLQQIRYPKFFN